MKTEKERRLEMAMRQKLIEDNLENMVPLEEMKRRVIEEGTRRDMEKKIKKRGILRRFAVAFVAVICLMVGSFAISITMPNVVANANNFIGRTFIWIGNKLNSEIESPLPVEQEELVSSITHADTTTEYTLDDIREMYGIELCEPGWLPDRMELRDVVVQKSEGDPFDFIKYWYGNDQCSFSISLDSNTGDGVVWFNETDTEILHIKDHVFYLQSIQETNSADLFYAGNHYLFEYDGERDILVTILENLIWD